MDSLKELKIEMQNLADPKKAEILQGFFKTGKGQYIGHRLSPPVIPEPMSTDMGISA